MKNRTDIGIVIIGRNEGDRLACSLNSVINMVHHVVYVDSGSTDDSLSLAEGLGVEVVELDMSIPFTAARARNAGFEKLCHSNPEISYVQFVDGDCEVVDGWIYSSVSTLESELQVGVVCGRLRERYPDYSVYNQLCDMEWDTLTGETKACGGIFMIRASLFKEMDGFNAALIAGEEPELCLRIRRKGWKICRLKVEMALHDANMLYFNQWWKRNVRSGYGYAEGAYMYGHEKERFQVAESGRIWLWGGIIPVLTIITSYFSSLFFFLLLLYPLQVVRIAIKEKINGKLNWSYAFFVTLGKFPEMQGQLKFWFDKLLNLKSKIIEYKD